MHKLTDLQVDIAGPGALTGKAMYNTLDLCVSCKGCKRECPTGVDMAKMKIEFLYHYQKRHGLSLKDRLVAWLPRYAPWAARLPWLFNLRNAVPGLAGLSEEGAARALELLADLSARMRKRYL